jgi:GTP pyrophosphokinase
VSDETLRLEYLSYYYPIYERLARLLRDEFAKALAEHQIPVFAITSRVKSFESFLEKSKRKNYTSPFDDTDDMCGLRIITFYSDDVVRVEEVIRADFDASEAREKLTDISDNRFGYRSSHFIVRHPNAKVEALRDDWRVEVQIRTLLMHAWASVSHQLVYKNEEKLPIPFRRRLAMLSAMFEMADQELVRLRSERLEYGVGNPVTGRHGLHLDVTGELNVNSLQEFLDFHFPDRFHDISETPRLLKDLQDYGIDLFLLHYVTRDLASYIDADRDAIVGFQSVRLAQCDAARYIMTIISKSYEDEHGEQQLSLERELIQARRRQLGIEQ